MNFNQAKYNFNESGGSAKPSLALTNPSSRDIIIEVFTANLTALGEFILTYLMCGILSSDNIGGGIDYDSGSYTITIPSGQTSATFSIAINDDNILEMNENFGLFINEHSLSTRVIVGNLNQATVTIVDNDGKK